MVCELTYSPCLGVDDFVHDISCQMHLCKSFLVVLLVILVFELGVDVAH